MFGSMVRELPNMWKQMVVGADGDCRELWQSIRTSDFVTRHPRLPFHDWDRIVPIGIHGDGGKFSHQDSLLTLSWNSILGRGPTLQKRFVFTVIRKSDMTDGTLDAIFRFFAWSVNALLEGLTPDRDWKGVSPRRAQD